MKKIQLVFSIISLVLDYLLLVAAGLVAYSLRFTGLAQSVRPVIFELPLTSYAELVVWVALVWIVIFAFMGLYTTSHRQKAAQELAKIFVGCSLGLLAIILFIFWSREFFSSRFIILAAWLLSVIFVSAGRLFLRSLRRYLLKRNKGVTSVVLVGEDKTTNQLASLFHKQPVWGFRVVEKMPVFDEDKATRLIRNGLDEIFLTDPHIDRETRLRVLGFCTAHHLGFRYTADIFDARSHNVSFQTMGGIPIIEIKKTPLEGWGRVAKRIFDVAVSAVLIVFLVPLFFLIAAIVKLDSQGPAVVRLRRVGKQGKTFNIYKFRSMIKNAHLLKYDSRGKVRPELAALNERKDGPLFKSVADPRITRVGTFLRRFSLDELPQLWNVLKGDMSLVGPRPHEPEEVQWYQNSHIKLLAIKPGMTGLAQLSGRSTLTFEEETRLDTYYVENWSLVLDIQILLKTPFVVFGERTAI